METDGRSAAALRRAVTSPGGTTEAAFDVFEAGRFAALLDEAVAAATERGRELSALEDSA